MDNLPPNWEIPRKTWVDRAQAFFEVLLVSGLLSSALAGLVFYLLQGKRGLDLLANAKAFSIFILLEAGIALLILTVVLKIHRETISTLGLKWDRWKFHCALGLVVVPFLFMINALVAVVFKIYLPQYFVEKNPITELIHTRQQLVLIVISALIAGGIKEELQRALILTRFRSYLGGAWLGLVLWSGVFGAGHYVQGVQGVVIATIYGFVFGIIYLMSGSLIAPIIAHGAYDAIALIAYWLFSGRFR